MLADLNLDIELKRLGLTRYGVVGKRIGDHVCVHRAYEDVYLDSDLLFHMSRKAARVVGKEFSYDVVRFGLKRPSVAFIQSEGFTAVIKS